ncbi:uncharacterized protein LOC122724903 isoform X2 [Manihot esculenta]|uniref:Uncharacterized protein n=1 Tax=Manihot esculenta TaxID=3983 RepID=A0ACB7GYW2_MANES|nr:uncharacterized protein LOC122724903 isoform X2 [Manihot esculenta]KAG8644960.1 hypothetical protein MANES_10G017915v8 [Manihot esculenta]
MIGLYHLTSSLFQVPIPLPHTGSHLPTSLSLKPQSQLKHADGSESLLTFLVPSPFSSFSSVPQPRPPTHPVASPAATHPRTHPLAKASQSLSLHPSRLQSRSHGHPPTQWDIPFRTADFQKMNKPFTLSLTVVLSLVLLFGEAKAIDPYKLKLIESHLGFCSEI